MIAVFPVCNRDIGLAIRHAEWLARMGHLNHRTALIWSEEGTHADPLGDILSKSFTVVRLMTYPSVANLGWPHRANSAWQRMAVTAPYFCQPWLWMEADAVALRPDWMDQIEAAYAKSQLPFMAPKVDHMSHYNGVAVYPANAWSIMPRAMSATSQAWDCAAAEEMQGRTFDAKRIMQHVWVVAGGKWLPCGGGAPPSSVTASEARRNLIEGAALVHRIKDSSLIELLMSGKLVP